MRPHSNKALSLPSTVDPQRNSSSKITIHIALTRDNTCSMRTTNTPRHIKSISPMNGIPYLKHVKRERVRRWIKSFVCAGGDHRYARLEISTAPIHQSTGMRGGIREHITLMTRYTSPVSITRAISLNHSCPQ